MRRFFTLFAAALLCMTSIQAQTADDQIDPENFDAELLADLITQRMNEFRLSNSMDGLLDLEILTTATQAQAESNLSIKRVDKKDDLGSRVKKAGGTSSAQGLAAYFSTKKGKDIFTYNQVAADVVEKFTKSKNDKAMVLTPDFYYTGVGVAFDADKNRAYVSQAFGKTNVVNEGADKKLRKSLPIKYSKKKRGLSPYEERNCKACEKYDQWQKLYNGISIVGNKVYLEYDNLKELKSLIRKDDDGLAVDFLQPAQYQCDGPNIFNAELPSKGWMTKPWYSDKILKKNEVEGKKVSSYYGPIGKIKKKVLKNLPDDYEYNIVVINKKTVCRTVQHSYLEDGGIPSLTIFSLYPDTAIASGGAGWEPSAEGNTLEFKVPFEQNKFDYKTKDIEPIITALNEPKYDIDDIFITAHSSLEGDSAKNKVLQLKRAESIVRAIEVITETDSLLNEENFSYSYGWEIFQEQIAEDEEYAYFVGMTYPEVQDLMRTDSEVMKKLMPLLDEQRFAEVRMEITYDISGEFEEPFVISQLRKAIDKKDGALALKIQKFAIKKVLSGKYDADNFIYMEVPTEAPFVSLKVNQIFLENLMYDDAEISEELMVEFEPLEKVAPENDFVNFNKYLLQVKFNNVADIAEINATQAGITSLYSSRISQQYVDALNLEFQFRIIEYLDSAGVEDEDLLEASLDRIKKIFKVEGSSWQNALKLGYIFMSYNDLDYAVKVMDPFITETEDVDEELLFTYISAAASDHPANIYTKNFRLAMTLAKDKNKKRYCDLFGPPYLSMQLMDHPIIKSEYCEACK